MNVLHPLLEHYSVPILFGYLVYDALVCLATPHLRTVDTIFHHTMGIAMCIFGQGLQFASSTIAIIILMEITTPFVNARWFAAVGGLKTHWIYMMSAICMWFGCTSNISLSKPLVSSIFNFFFDCSFDFSTI